MKELNVPRAFLRSSLDKGDLLFLKESRFFMKVVKAPKSSTVAASACLLKR